MNAHPNSRSLEYPEHAMLISKKKVKSPAWAYYGLPADENGRLVSENISICRLCEHAVSCKMGSTTNLITHLKLYHQKEYAKITPWFVNKPSASTSVSNVTDKHGEISCEPGIVSIKLEEVRVTTEQEMPPAKKQKICDDSQPVESESENQCTNTVTKFIAATMQPCSIVKSQAFVEMLKALNPNYKLPERNFFSQTVLPKLYNSIKDNIKQQLASIKSSDISITIDSWTSIDNFLYIAVTAHFIDAEWQLKSVCLSCRYFDEDQTADSIKEALVNISSEWNLDIDQLCSFTTDNGANISKAVSLLKAQHIPCFGQTVDSGVNRAFKIGSLQKAIAKLKNLLSTVAHSGKMTRELAKAQESLQMDVVQIQNAYPKWWNTLKMCNEYLQNQSLIHKLIQNYPAKKSLMLEASEVSSLEDLIAATKLMDVITKNLSGEDYVTASSVLPLLQKITKNVQIEETDNILLKEIKKRIFSVVMECYYENEKLMEDLGISTFCDPRFRLNYVDNSAEIKEFVLSYITEIYATNMTEMYATDTTPVVESKVKSGLAILLEDDEDERYEEKYILPRAKADQQVKLYLSLPKVHLSKNPLDWWKSHEHSFPTLKVLARKFLAMQGTNNPSERVFGTGGDLITKNRASLSPKYAEMQVFLAQNKCLI